VAVQERASVVKLGDVFLTSYNMLLLASVVVAGVQLRGSWQLPLLPQF